MNEKLKQFINENIDLINENTKESWEEIYKKSNQYYLLTGRLTNTLLTVGIDPASILGYIPVNYLGKGDIQNYKIPHNVIDIGDYAFSYCDKLENIEIPKSVLKIGYCSFAYCKSLNYVVIENNMIDVDDYAFQYCDNLKEVIYKGTKEEAFKCGLMKRRWRRGSPIEKIICIDGEILL